jgi:selenide,water dikinase
MIPGAAFRNLEYTEGDTLFEEDLDYNLKMIAHDAQTSGGLLMAVAEAQSGSLLADLHLSGHPEAAVIGTVRQKGAASLLVAN